MSTLLATSFVRRCRSSVCFNPLSRCVNRFDVPGGVAGPFAPFGSGRPVPPSAWSAGVVVVPLSAARLVARFAWGFALPLSRGFVVVPRSFLRRRLGYLRSLSCLGRPASLSGRLP